ncbi:hypothetical protein CROQUDRAFT_665925 [Cronartium quercuum f. sp. fusiforme G11]|uniref:Uncharacterized protein n=1 Tax=Cronartium quercuum f. sp. fusiforme G11 TaxID=708437 RepID=A0A9P6N8T8_9BASI|nr:hypothetical protein CROQUDRAFT_665925 [Cronartium quercuum f. sp. fusiforme G11]
MPPPKLVVCKCSQCITNTYTDDNSQKHHGTYVSARNRQKHQASDFEKRKESTSAAFRLDRLFLLR